MITTKNPLISWRKAAIEFNLPSSWIKRQIKDGRIPSVRVGNVAHVSRAGLERALRVMAGERVDD